MTPLQTRLNAPFTPQGVAAPAESEPDYLNAGYGAFSWLFTTDHKRIAILYLVSITMMFLVGGIAATLIRLTLLTNNGGFISADGYNRLFSAHGIVMVF